MFGIGVPELLLILILALLILGPEELPKVGRELGRAFRSFQQAANDMKESITKEMGDTDKEIGHAPDDEEKDKKE